MDWLRGIGLGLRPAPAHAGGAPVTRLPAAEFMAATWAAGIAMTAEEDPVPRLALVGSDAALWLRPAWVAEALFGSIPLALCRPVEHWRELWPDYEGQVAAFLGALQAAEPDLAAGDHAKHEPARQIDYAHRLVFDRLHVPRPRVKVLRAPNGACAGSNSALQTGQP
jgi:hypothetical protein